MVSSGEMRETFGKYRLTKRLAYGGMAEVFLATVHGEAGFSKPVVIKRLHPRLSEDSEFVHMLIDEARITAQLTHGNIGQVLDLGAVDGSYYIAMEFVSGEELRAVHKRFVDDGREFPLDAALYVMTEMLAGLEYAHNKVDSEGAPLHIIHRDVSPQNVMVSYEGDVKVIDFGIAKAQSRMVKTQAGVIKGKFRYMSPEQASGTEIDRRTDIFASGVVLYELLRNEPHLHDVPDTEALRRMREADLEPLDVARPDLPRPLVALVHQALTRRPERRYQTAEQFRRAIADYMHDQRMAFGRAHLAALMRDRFSTKRRQERGGSVPGRMVQAPTREPTEAFDSSAGIDRRAYERTATSGAHAVHTESVSASDIGLEPIDTTQETRRFDDGRWASAAIPPAPGPGVDEGPDRDGDGYGEPYDGHDLHDRRGSLAESGARQGSTVEGHGALARRMRGPGPPPDDRPVFATPMAAASSYDETQFETPHDPRPHDPRPHDPRPHDPRPHDPPAQAPPGGAPTGEPHDARHNVRGAGAFTRTAAAPSPPRVERTAHQRWDPGPGGGASRERGGATDPAKMEPSLASVVGRKVAHGVGKGIGWVITLGALVAVLIGGAYVAKRMGLLDRDDKPAGTLPPDGGPRRLDGLGAHVADGGVGGTKGELVVVSRPAGARVTVCGRDPGHLTPVTVALGTDERCEVVVSLKGFATFRSDPVAMSAGRRKRILAVLRRVARRRPRPRPRPTPPPKAAASPETEMPAGRGRLVVTSIEIGTVFVNGRRVGRTPRLQLHLTPGTHTVYLRYDRGGGGERRQAVVRVGLRTNLHFESP